MEFAKRVLDIQPSATFKYSALAKAEGVCNLTVGRPDFDTPACIKEAAIEALRAGKVHYTPSKGIPELREKIVEKLVTENNLNEIDSEKVIVSPCKHLLFEAIMATVDSGDVVAMANPSWVSYEQMIKMAGGKVEWLTTRPEEGFIPGNEYFTELENSNAKLIMLNSPHNPTGAVYPEKTLREIAKIAESLDAWIISDETYEKQIYEGKHFSVGSIYPNTITINSFSKTYSMTGWRVGYVACPDFEVIRKMGIIQEQSISCATSFAQYGCLACFTDEANQEVTKMVEELKDRRDYVMERMKDLNVVCKKPAGTFYAFPYIEGIDDVELADALLEAKVGIVPGSPFGTNGRGCIRISYGSADKELLGEAFDRMMKVKGLAK